MLGQPKNNRNMPLPSGFLTDGFSMFPFPLCFVWIFMECAMAPQLNTAELLDEDVGNANFRDQIRRAESLEARGLRFLGMGS